MCQLVAEVHDPARLRYARKGIVRDVAQCQERFSDNDEFALYGGPDKGVS